MTPTELLDIISFLREKKTETQTIEVKAAHTECPRRLFDTLSSFSNQDDGGVLVFGLDERLGFAPVGVYDAHDLQKRVTEQCEQMTPCLRPVFTVVELEGKLILSAEIPSVDIAERPCFYAGVGRIKGSYIRVGDADKRMSEYEIYSYEAYKKRYRDDIRPVSQASFQALDADQVGRYLYEIRKRRPNCAALDDCQICELMSLTKGGIPTLASILLFGLYPQAFFPQLVVTATVSAGQTLADNMPDEPRFLDNKRIEGTIQSLYDETMDFIRRNMRVETVVDPKTGLRKDRNEYPLLAVREAIINAMMHRDYSKYTEGRPITVNFFNDRLEIANPGGLYGRICVDDLGRVTPDTRNPFLVTALETLQLAENRYSGIPTIRNAMQRSGLPEPEFLDNGDTFMVILRNGHRSAQSAVQAISTQRSNPVSPSVASLLQFCTEPRSRQEIAGFLNIASVSYAMRAHVVPLLQDGSMEMMYPDCPKSRKQRYRTAKA